MKITKVREHSFIAELIRPGGYAIDCGAHKGEFSKAMASTYGVNVFAFEADPALFQKLPKIENVRFIHSAISGEDGQLAFSKPDGQDGSVVYYKKSEGRSEIVKSVHLSKFIDEQIPGEEVELLKLDIEGAEIAALESAPDITLKKIKQITVEFHDFLNKEDIPAIKRTILRIETLGFHSFKVSHFTYGDMFFVNSRKVSLNFIQRLKIRVFDIWVKGIIRFLARKMRAF
jgi:FkbM family methyltransferase